MPPGCFDKVRKKRAAMSNSFSFYWSKNSPHIMNYGSSTGDRRREYKKRFSERYTKILLFNGNNGTLKKNDADICINRGGAAKIPNMN